MKVDPFALRCREGEGGGQKNFKDSHLKPCEVTH